MPDPDYYRQADSGLLLAPPTRQHAIERAHLWWSIVMIDFQVSIILGVPRHIRLDPLEVMCDFPCCQFEPNVVVQPGAITTRLPMAFDISPPVRRVLLSDLYDRASDFPV